ncbi:hypothetical protein NQ317_012898 [Molorchus minor]|uniref:Uncharacterized protein n=1 Tax=Molorchus minor TaxID=1323400 RepID=A0ABQ9JP62_9CUCU|nr:hypothetical protein NQ317_012898 [Molorchus minor]
MLNLRFIVIVVHGVGDMKIWKKSDSILVANARFARRPDFVRTVRHLISANCNCHVINNAAKFAAKILSVDVETLIIKTYDESFLHLQKKRPLKDFFVNS